MRTVISSILTLLILCTTIGIRVNKHYCSKSKQANYSLTKQSSCCTKHKPSCPLHELESNCCIDSSDLIRLGNDVHFIKKEIVSNQSFTFNNLDYFYALAKKTNTYPESNLKGRAPPLVSKNTSNPQAYFQVFII